MIHPKTMSMILIFYASKRFFPFSTFLDIFLLKFSYSSQCSSNLNESKSFYVKPRPWKRISKNSTTFVPPSPDRLPNPRSWWLPRTGNRQKSLTQRNQEAFELAEAIEQKDQRPQLKNRDFSGHLAGTGRWRFGTFHLDDVHAIWTKMIRRHPRFSRPSPKTRGKTTNIEEGKNWEKQNRKKKRL